jgi:hypothetical protein
VISRSRNRSDLYTIWSFGNFGISKLLCLLDPVELPAMSMDGRVAVVTGGTFGVGGGVARELARQGRAIAALAADPDVLRHTGKVLVAAAVAKEYGFTDIDGKQPRPLTLGDV